MRAWQAARDVLSAPGNGVQALFFAPLFIPSRP